MISFARPGATGAAARAYPLHVNAEVSSPPDISTNIRITLARSSRAEHREFLPHRTIGPGIYTIGPSLGKDVKFFLELYFVIGTYY